MWYEFVQNNSGGRFEIDDTVAERVWIESDSPESANKKAESIGIYFDGVKTGADCGCCGSRWTRAHACDSAESEHEMKNMIAASMFQRSYRLHFANGNVERFDF